MSNSPKHPLRKSESVVSKVRTLEENIRDKLFQAAIAVSDLTPLSKQDITTIQNHPIYATTPTAMTNLT